MPKIHAFLVSNDDINIRHGIFGPLNLAWAIPFYGWTIKQWPWTSKPFYL